MLDNITPWIQSQPGTSFFFKANCNLPGRAVGALVQWAMSPALMYSLKNKSPLKVWDYGLVAEFLSGMCAYTPPTPILEKKNSLKSPTPQKVETLIFVPTSLTLNQSWQASGLWHLDLQMSELHSRSGFQPWVFRAPQHSRHPIAWLCTMEPYQGLGVAQWKNRHACTGQSSDPSDCFWRQPYGNSLLGNYAKLAADSRI